MSSLSLLYNLANYTPADATPVESNFNQVEQHINQELIERDGTVAMRQALRLANSTPLNALDAASKGYVDGQVTPVSAGLARAGIQLTPTTGQAATFGVPLTIIWSAAPREEGGDWWTSGTNAVVPAGAAGVYDFGAFIEMNGGSSGSSRLMVNGVTPTAVWGSYYILNVGDVLTVQYTIFSGTNDTVKAGGAVSLVRVSI